MISNHKKCRREWLTAPGIKMLIILKTNTVYSNSQLPLIFFNFLTLQFVLFSFIIPGTIDNSAFSTEELHKKEESSLR